MTEVFQPQAIQVADENNALRARLRALEREEQRANGTHRGGQLDTTSADRLRSKNNALRDEIADLRQELTQLRMTNVTELHHCYQRLDSKRAYLTNENASLRNVLANQRKDVRRAMNNASAYQDVRRHSDEQNAAAKEDVRTFKERREALQKECAKLTRKEARLQNELAAMPASTEDIDAEHRKLLDENTKEGVLIEDLEHRLEELKAEQRTQGQREEEEPRASNASSADVAELRREYVHLKAMLKEVKLARAAPSTVLPR